MTSEKRISTLKRLAIKLESGENASQRDMKRALTAYEYRSYLRLWSEAKSARNCKKPEKIRRYQELLTKACTAYYKLDTYSSQRNPSPSLLQKQQRQVNLTFSAAQEFIQEAISADEELRLWLDRDPFDESALSPEPASIPRVIGSKSHECQSERSTPYPTPSKREVKLQALSAALENLKNETNSGFSLPPSALREKLTALENAFV